LHQKKRGAWIGGASPQGSEERSLLSLLSKGEKIDKQHKYFKEKVAINAKGGECWTQWYDIVIDVNRVQVMRSKLRRDNVAGRRSPSLHRRIPCKGSSYNNR
jgi:hypothetical protein